MRLRTALAGVCLWLASAGAAGAHPTPFSYVDLTLGAATLEGTVVVHVLDAAHDLRVAPPESLLTPEGAAQVAGRLARLVAERLRIVADGQVLQPSCSPAEIIPDRDSLRVAVVFPLPRRPGVITVAGPLFPYDPKHQTFLSLREDGWLAQAMLESGRATFDYYPGTRQGTLAAMRRFLFAGARHILVGADHLLFLAGLLLAGGSLRRLAAIVTAFTAAHSLTLTLAAIEVLSPPARIVEPAIALSLVYVGVDNLRPRAERDTRAWIAFLFGFIHGFGFADVLRETGLPVRALAWSLFSFNLGVELGQLCVVALLASALSALRASSETRGRQVVWVGSAAVMAAGVFWFVQRAFFPSLT